MKRLVTVVAAAALAAASALWLFGTGYFAQINSTAFDFTLRLAGPLLPSSPVTIVAIDEESLAEYGSWPWSRDKLALLIGGAARGGAKAIAVDLLLEDAKEDAKGAEEDRALAMEIGAARSVVLAARIESIDGERRWLRPNPRFLLPNVRLGHVHADPDFDGISRRVYSAKIAEGVPIAALSMEALRAAGIELEPPFRQADSIPAIVPQPIRIRFAGDRGTFAQVSARNVLNGSAGANLFQDRIVLIGTTAQGLGNDQWFTPFSKSGSRMSGVEIHANVIESLYAHRWVTDASGPALFLFLFLIVVLLWWFDRRFEGGRFYMIAVIMGPAVVAMSWFLMKQSSVWLPFPPMLAVIVFVVPALEALKVTGMNRDLDLKIAKLSHWGETDRLEGGPNVRERLSRELAPSLQKDAWLSMLELFGGDERRSLDQRKRWLSVPWKNFRWRLDALDFFNAEVVRFLSLNSAILGSIEDVIIVSDIAGRVVYQNPAARRLEGFREDPGFAPDYFSGLLDGRSLLPDFADVLSGHGTVLLESVPSPNGARYFNLILSPISKTGLVVCMHDATAQHQLNLAKTEMVSFVSHELRTPLTSIHGYSDMLLKYDLVEARGRPFLDTIIEESQRLNRLIQSLLDIAYIESGHQKVTKTEFEITPMLQEMLSAAGPQAASKEIHLEAPPENRLTVRADRLLLYQALSNLVGNAIKYSPGGTTVSIAVTNGAGRVRFHVRDQGCGIPAGESTRIFEKFYRRANKETHEQGGFGLGLTFVKEVASRHGGEIAVESEPGGGSTFILSVPN